MTLASQAIVFPRHLRQDMPVTRDHKQDNGNEKMDTPENSPVEKGAPQRVWIKRYRTEVAASMSSVLSTFSAVGDPSQILVTR